MPFELQWGTRTCADGYIDGLLAHWSSGLQIRLGTPFDFRVVGAPHQISRPDAGRIDGTVGELQLGSSRLDWRGMVHATALFGLGGATPIRRIEYDAVAGFQRDLSFNNNAFAPGFSYS